MISTSLPLRQHEHGIPVRNMVTLPSIHELGLLGSREADRTTSPSDLGRSQTSSPSTESTYSQRLQKSEEHTRTSQLLTQPSYNHESFSTIFTKSSLHSDGSSRPTGILPLEPRVTASQQDIFEEYSSSRERRGDWRRGSSDSLSSTPSLVGSFASRCSSKDITSPPLIPSTPRDFVSMWDLGGKDYGLVQASESDSIWIKPFLHNPFSSKFPRRHSHKAQSPSLGSQQSAYKVQKKERAKPKNTGQAHCNEKYTTEEDRFLVYFRVDHTMTWQQVETMYNERFTRGSRPYRTDGGLQSQFYRLNKVCPVLTDDKLLVFGPTTEAEAKVNQYNEYDNLTWDCKQRQGKPASLVDRYAEQIVEEQWEWISEEDMAEAKRLADLRRPHRLAWQEWKKANRVLVKTETASDEEDGQD